MPNTIAQISDTLRIQMFKFNLKVFQTLNKNKIKAEQSET